MSPNPPLSTSSYLNHLPAIFQEGPAFLGRFLLAFESILSGLPPATKTELAGQGDDLPIPVGLEEALGHIHTYFDPDQTPEDFLPWLASWVALSLRADWDTETKRAFIRQIVPLYRLRGTKAGLERMLEIYTGENVIIYDHYEQPAHYFQVGMVLKEGEVDQLRRKEQIARAIIEQEKPAHTFYALRISVPTMRLPPSPDSERQARLGTDETLLGTIFPEEEDF